MKDLGRDELIQLNGGMIKLPKLIRGGFWLTAAKFLYDHYNEIKSGAVDGWNYGGKED